MRLIPDSGSPGDTVKIEGFLPDGPNSAQAEKDTNFLHADVCWGACADGLVEIDQPVIWSKEEAGRFTSQLLVPPIPWVTSQGAQPLTAGDYSVSMQCLGPGLEGCALQPGQPSAIFHLQGSSSTRCQAGAPCTEIILTPGQASPGETVKVSGWAPLDRLFSGQPSDYSLAVQLPETREIIPIEQLKQTLSGELSGSFQVPASLPGIGLLKTNQLDLVLTVYRTVSADQMQTIVLASSPLMLSSPTAWSNLNLSTPIIVQYSADLLNSQLAQDIAHPQRMAYCLPGAIQVTADGGNSWRSIPISGVIKALEGTKYTFGTNGTVQPTCLSISLDSNHPESFFAVFPTQYTEFGAPPIIFMGFYSVDNGNSWQLAPAPSMDLVEAFGSYTTGKKGLIQALYGSNPQSGAPEVAPQVFIQQTEDGGKTWAIGEMICSDSPCLSWGPAPSMIPGMGSPLPQWVYASSNEGQTWHSSATPVELRMPGPNQLVTFKDKFVLLISGSGDYPIRQSTDAGATWQTISLPPLADEAFTGQYPALQVLPDSSLIGMLPSSSQWAILPPHGSAWCTLTGVNMPTIPVTLRFSEGKAWWFDASTAKPGSLQLDKLHCP
jgi:hypothetical protein